MSVNKVILIGNVGGEIKSSTTKGGAAVCNFSLATNDRWKDKTTGEDKEVTEWHQCSAFGRHAEVLAQYGQSGMELYIEGKITTSKYKDKEGNDRKSTDILVREFQFISKKEEKSNNPPPDDFEDDGIPF
ncbi:single-stranded DNA-binding protein [Porticoccaceae bacterium]|nr:single-stranded DNA-binding protein [Porticoccaceae bacterium]